MVQSVVQPVVQPVGLPVQLPLRRLPLPLRQLATWQQALLPLPNRVSV